MDIREWFYNVMISFGCDPATADALHGWVMLVGIIICVVVINAIIRLGVIRAVRWVVHRTKFTWDDIIFDEKVMRRLGNILMPIIIKIAISSIIVALNITGAWLQNALYCVVDIWIVVSVLLFINSLLIAFYELLEQRPGLQGRPIRGLLQTCQVILILIGVILIVAILMNESPAILLTGLGASAAVISFIFKDSLMGLIAGIQLSVNNMLKVGDWIEMPSRGIDGTVIEVSLTTIKVRSWDNTIQTIAPYLLISEPFSNWQAMRDTGGRRIKRSLNIDMSSVQLMDEESLAKLSEDKFITKLLSNIKTMTEEGEMVTNLDLYMRVINRFIDLHPRVNHTMIAMVRQLQPTQWGLPIELYFFSADVNWVPYEHLQAEVISRIIALAPHFGIRLYQAPSGEDFKIK